MRESERSLRLQRCDYRGGLILIPARCNTRAFNEWDGFVRNEHTRTREERSITGIRNGA
ncbi:MAG: hypothetical protein JXA44_13200 [Methanospirillaceae archaeon]|nr:hypothetical protein [Methanospirillaceae archaeon]